MKRFSDAKVGDLVYVSPSGVCAITRVDHRRGGWFLVGYGSYATSFDLDGNVIAGDALKAHKIEGELAKILKNQTDLTIRYNSRKNLIDEIVPMLEGKDISSLSDYVATLPDDHLPHKIQLINDELFDWLDKEENK